MDWSSISVNSSSNKELDNILDQLRTIAPHIKWRIKSYDYETLDGSLTYYNVLEVPDDQVEEAEELIERWENGEDLSDYSELDRYEGLYIKMNNGHIVNPVVLKFQSLVCKFNETLMRAGKMDVEEFAIAIAQIVSAIYVLALELPQSRDTSDIDNREFNGVIFSEETYLQSQYAGCREELMKIAIHLREIYALLNIKESTSLFYECNKLEKVSPEVLSKKVHEWRFYFFASYDWGLGNRCLEVLRLIREVLLHLE